jgi:hypothetical protein
MNSDELADILEVSRVNNARRNITGILFYKNREFLQVLEGEKAVIDRVLQTISEDPRHSGIVILLRDNLPRMFSDWSMNFANLEEIENEGEGGTATRLEQAPWTASLAKRAPLRVRKLLISFGAA